jgi:ATP-dependent RNA helicase DeaD
LNFPPAALVKIIMEDQVKEQNAQVDDEDFENTGGSQGMVRLFINIGRKQGVSAKNIVGAIAGETGMPGKLIGSIDIYDKYTFVEVPSENAKQVLKIMQDVEIKGTKINIEPANKK